MPRERPHRIDSRSRSRRREQYRPQLSEGQQAQHDAAQDHQDPPAIAALNDLVELQLQNPVANDPAAHGAEQPHIPHENHIQEMPNQLPAPHHLGDMNYRCPHCASRYFQEECNTQGIFTKCCVQGKVALPPIVLPPPNNIELFTGDAAQSRHFLENIRHYNAAFAMASWNATLNEHAGRGPRVVTIHGQAYHLTAAQEVPEGQPPQYAQLYILDTNEAMQHRMNDPRNQNLRPDILLILQDGLLAVNPYARQYQNMGQIHQRERQKLLLPTISLFSL